MIPVVELLTGELTTEIRRRFAEMLELRARVDGNVEANREYVEAMLGVQAWVHSLYRSMHGQPHEHAHEH